ncbi:MAG: protein kinase domain-containing protein [Acidimicrobiales bacterium]
MGRNGVEIQVLGPLGVFRDGQELELGPQLRRVLAVLVARHGSVVSMDRLVDAVWYGDPPDGAAGSVRTYVTRLRKVVDPDRAGRIVFRDPGYVLSLDDPGTAAGEGLVVDSEAFEAELAEAAQMLRTAEDEQAVAVLTAALDRWRGEAWAGFADEDWARPGAVRLEERRIEATELLIEARLGIGDTERAVSEARLLTETEPLRERPRALLMRALYSGGRRAEALSEFRRFRSLLVEEAGLDPSPDLLELEGRIGRDDPTLAGAGRALRGYQLGERIGEGAFAVVHRAVQPGVEREVAIKIIRAGLADRPEFVRRFEHEARIVASVEHPHVVPLHDFWREPGAGYLVMRLLRGGSVEGTLRARGPWSQRATADLVRDIGSALEAAHRKGVVHRDVRPANLLLDENGSVYLADFGIALPAADADGGAVASPAHAAPELLRGQPVGPAADVLSLGITTFQLLTGRLPFADSDSRAELIRRQLAEPLPSARAIRTDLPVRIDEVLARATAKAPEDRHATIGALVEELIEVLGGEGPATRRSGSRPAGATVENPYVGLRAFGDTDAEHFHGREALVTELLESLSARPLTVVVGPSGSGKSSVVRGGLIPAIRAGAIAGSADWFVTQMVPGSDPIQALETALLRVAVNPPASLRDQLAEDGGLLRAVLRVLPDDTTTLLIVIDQLEELFTMSGSTERARFLHELAAAVTAPGSPLRVVATLRADHYDVPLRHPAFAELVTAGTVTVRPMTPAELERVVVLPAASVGVDVEPALVADLVAGVSEQPAALPMLQYALTEAFERRVSDVMLASVHHDLGGLSGAVAARADRILELGGPDDEAEARRIFGRLVTLGEGVEDTRRRARRSELGSGERTAWLLDAFAHARLVTVGRDEATRQPTVEVAHEALLREWPRLRGWLAEDRDDLRALGAVSAGTATWLGHGRDDGELARGGRLATASELAARRPDLLSGEEAAWIAASSDAADGEAAALADVASRDRRQNQRLRRLLVAAAVLSMMAAAAAIVALVQRGRAVESENQAVAAEAAALENERLAVAARTDAEIERLSALSGAQIGQSPDRAILLALEANRRRDDVGTRSALHAAIAAQPAIVGIVGADPEAGGQRTVFGQNGTVALAVSTSADGDLLRWLDPATGDDVAEPTRLDTTVDLAALSGDGSVAAVALRDGTVRFLDPTGREVGPAAPLGTRLYDLSLDETGRRVALRLETGTQVLDVASGATISTYTDPRDQPGVFVEAPVALAADGDLFVVSWVHPAGDGVIQDLEQAEGGIDVVDAETGALIERIEGRLVNALDLSSRDVMVVAYDDREVFVDVVGRNGASRTIAGIVGDVSAVGIGSDGTVGVATFEGDLAFWDDEGAPLTGIVETGGAVTSLAFDDEGNALASIDGAGHLRFDPDGSVMVERLIELRGLANNVSPFHPFFEAARDDGQAVQFRRLADNTVAREIPLVEAYEFGFGGDPFYSTNGEWALSYGASRTSPVIVQRILGGGRGVVDLAAAYESATGVAVTDDFIVTARPSDDGQRVFLAARDFAGGPAFALWVSMDGAVLAGPMELPALGPALPLADGRVVMGDGESTLFVLDADLAGPPTTIADSDGFRALDIDDASGTVLVGSPSGAVGLLDLATGGLRRIESIAGEVAAGTFSPDGTALGILAVGGEVQVFDVETGRRVGVPMTLDGTLILPRGLHWGSAEDGGGLWVGSFIGPINFAADADAWRRIACDLVGRDLTADEWRTFVSETDPPVSACSR